MIVVVFFSCSSSKMLVKFWGRLPSCRSTHWCIPAEEGGRRASWAPCLYLEKMWSVCWAFLPWTWKRCLCVSSLVLCLSWVPACAHCSYLKQGTCLQWGALFEKCPCSKRNRKAGRIWFVHRMPASYLPCNSWEKHSKYMETGFISCTGQQGEGMSKLS